MEGTKMFLEGKVDAALCLSRKDGIKREMIADLTSKNASIRGYTSHFHRHKALTLESFGIRSHEIRSVGLREIVISTSVWFVEDEMKSERQFVRSWACCYVLATTNDALA